jgi:hypothetical protein
MRKIVLLLAMLAMAFCASGAAAYKAAITFSGYARSETLTNFPVLVSLTNIPGFSISRLADASARDVRFWNDASLTMALNAEPDTIRVGTNALFWVQVPVLTATTTVLVSWGDASLAGATPASWTNGSTWTGLSPLLIMHGSTNTAGLVVESAYKKHLTNTSVVVAGWIGDALVVNTTPRYITLDGRFTNYTGKFSFRYLFTGSSSSLQYLYDQQSGRMVFGRYDSPLQYYDGLWRSTAGPWGGTWSYNGYSGGTSMNVMVNGVCVLTNGTFACQNTAAGTLIKVGARYDVSGYNVDGYLDEIRITANAPSTNWMWAEWYNMKSNGLFQAYGAAMPAVLRPSAVFFQ